MAAKGYWLRVSYTLGASYFDRRTLDNLIVKAVGHGDYDSGAGFGQRDLEFLFATKAAATDARRRVVAATLPVALETEVRRQA